MPSEYGSVFAFLIVAVAFGAVNLAVGWLIRPHRPYARKRETYECGTQPLGQAWHLYHVQYYIFALIFVIFEMEAAFLYPWVPVARELGTPGFVAAGVFLVIITLGLFYEWGRGALEWV